MTSLGGGHLWEEIRAFATQGTIIVWPGVGGCGEEDSSHACLSHLLRWKQKAILTWKANAHQANEGPKFWATLGNKLMISRNTSNTPMFQYWLFWLNHNMYACNDCFHCAFSNLSFTCVHSDALCIFIPLMMAINWGTTQVWGQKYDWRTFVQAALQMRTLVIFAHPGSWKSVSNIKMNKHLLKVYFVFDIQKTWKDNTVLPLEVPLIFGTGDWQSTPIPLLDHEGVKSTFRLCNNDRTGVH